MTKYYKLIFLLIAGIAGYILGNFIPIEIFKPKFIDESISKTEYYKIMLSIVSAFITFCAVLVALFKDDFREYWKRPRIQFHTPNDITIEDLSASLESETTGDNIYANKYISRIEVKNIGNLPALNSEVYLDKLEFIAKNTSIAQAIECPGTALEWNGADIQNIIIPPGGKKLINIIEVTPPEKISTPESEKTNKPACLIIGNIKSTREQPNGKWIATFSLYAQNHKPVSFKLEIEWTGVWKNRLTEFNNQFKISKKA